MKKLLNSIFKCKENYKKILDMFSEQDEE